MPDASLVLDHASQIVASAAGNLSAGTVAAQLLALDGRASHPGFAGTYYVPVTAPGTLALVWANSGRLYGHPFYVGATTTFTRIGFEVTAAGSAGTKVRLGIYRCAAGVPTSLVLASGELATDSIAVVEATCSVVLTPGWYVLAHLFSGTPNVRAYTPGNYAVLLGLASSFGANLAYYSVQSYGAMPENWPTVAYATAGNMPLIWLRIA